MINAQFDHLDVLSTLLIVLSVIIGLLAVVNMRLSNLSIVPALKDRHQLVTHGIYRIIRHPMYTSVLLFSLAFTLTNPHSLSLLIMLVLFIDLILKSSVEEALLTERFNTYYDYKNKTGRFLPFL
jgi:protein-S-isoprenylcysteine O-methyltransferase Ste14